MKVLFVHPNNDFTGSTKVLYDVISEEYNQFDCVVLTLNNSVGFLSQNSRIKIKKIWFPTFNHKVIPVVTPLLSLMSRLILCFLYIPRVDLVYINTIKPYYAAIVANIFHRRIIWHIHEFFKIKSFPVKIMEIVQHNTKAHFIFVSKYVKEQYTLSGQSSFEIKYNKLSSDFLSKVEPRIVGNRNLKEILMPASLTRAKGIYTFVEVARAMPDYNFTLVLSCSEEEKNEFVLSVNPTVNCNVLARQSNMHSLYKHADVVLNLSNPLYVVETFGMTLIEAFSYGIPVVAPNVGGPLEIIDDAINGYCVDVQSVVNIENAIREITKSPEIYRGFSINALRKSKQFS